MIEVSNLTFAYTNAAAPVLRDFSAGFERGEIVALTGKNGCGKTTLTKLLVGLLRPSSGRVAVDESDIGPMDLFAIGKRVGYVFQNPNRQLFCETAYEEVAYGVRKLGKNEADTETIVNRHLERFGLTRYRGIFPGKLSLGEKQRLVLAAILALGTSYLVLDEPTTGLDAGRRAELGETLLQTRGELNCGIIVAGHDEAFFARYADRELVMAK